MRFTNSSIALYFKVDTIQIALVNPRGPNSDYFLKQVGLYLYDGSNDVDIQLVN